jgi:hypothetical protein
MNLFINLEKSNSMPLKIKIADKIDADLFSKNGEEFLNELKK